MYREKLAHRPQRLLHSAPTLEANRTLHSLVKAILYLYNTYTKTNNNGRIQEIRYREDPGAAYVPDSWDIQQLIPLVSGNSNHNQQQSNQGYGGQQSGGMPGGFGGQQQQAPNQGNYGGQGQDFGVTGGPQYNAPHGSGGASSAGGGGIGSLLGMMNRMSIVITGSGH
jgi:hypothetical protein